MDSAIQHLVNMRDTESLYEIMTENEDFMYCLDAAEGLVTLGDMRGIEFLQDAIQSEDEDIKTVAEEILASPEVRRMREDVEATLDQHIGRKPKKNRRDLWSPFGDETNFPDAAHAAAARIRDAKAAKAHAEDSLSSAELNALRELQKAALSLSHAEQEKKSKKSGDVRKLPKRNGLTGDALLRNGRLYRERSKR